MGAFSALDQHVSPTYVAKYGTVKKFVQDLEDTERGLNISSITLLHESGCEKHEYLIVQAQSLENTYFIRLDRRAKITGNSSVAKSSLAASSSLYADDEITITRQSIENEEFSKQTATVRAKVTFTSMLRPRIWNLLSTALQMLKHVGMKDYNLYWANCWAFARTILFKLTVRSGYISQVTVRDATSRILLPGDLEEFLHRLMTEDAVMMSGAAVGLVAGGFAAGPTAGLGFTGAAWAIGQAGFTGTVVAGPVGTLAGIGCGAFAVLGSGYLGGVVGFAAHELLWAYPLVRKWKKICDSINSHDLGCLAV